jgi:hypothetical protein
MPASKELPGFLLAAVDQAKADGSKRLDTLLASIRQHTQDSTDPEATIIISLALAMLKDTTRTDLLHAAICRLLTPAEQED